MIFFWALLVAAAVSNVSGNRIANGETTTIQNYPYVVQVEFQLGFLWTQSCGGIILNTLNVGTSAACISGLLVLPRTRRIRAGTSSRGSGGVTIVADELLVHPDYQQRGEDSDIGIIKLRTRLTTGPNIAIASIPSQGFEMPDNIPVFVVGWGVEHPGSVLGSGTIRHASVQTINHNNCVREYQELLFPRIVTENMMCIGQVNTQNAPSPCSGDFGGPVTYQGIVVGLSSWVYECGSVTLPAVATKISSFTTWIGNNVQ